MSVESNNSPAVGGQREMKESCEHQEQCMQMIQAILDGEASEADKEHFRQNMDVCMPCINEYHLAKCIKDSLCQKIERKSCPENLITTIKLKLDLL